MIEEETIEIPLIIPEYGSHIKYTWIGYKLLGKHIYPLCTKIVFAPEVSMLGRIKIIFHAFFVSPWYIIKAYKNLTKLI